MLSDWFTPRHERKYNLVKKQDTLQYAALTQSTCTHRTHKTEYRRQNVKYWKEKDTRYSADLISMLPFSQSVHLLVARHCSSRWFSFRLPIVTIIIFLLCLRPLPPYYMALQYFIRCPSWQHTTQWNIHTTPHEHHERTRRHVFRALIAAAYILSHDSLTTVLLKTRLFTLHVN